MSKKKSVWQRMRSGWQVYALLLLPVIYLIVFCYIPMGGLVLAFKKYDLSKGILGSPWVGFDNFLKFFRSYKFTIVLKNTLTLAVYSLLVGFPIPILFALLLNAFPECNVHSSFYFYRCDSRYYFPAVKQPGRYLWKPVHFLYRSECTGYPVKRKIFQAYFCMVRYLAEYRL